MKKWCVILIVILFFILGCTQRENSEALSYDDIDKSQNKKDLENNEIVQEQRENLPQLGNLCSGEEECIAFCLNNRGRCEEYCKGNENALCSVIFPSVESSEKKQIENKIGQNGCEGTKTKFNFAPVNLDETKVFLPLGLMIGSHVTPIDHHYFQNFDNVGYNSKSP